LVKAGKISATYSFASEEGMYIDGTIKAQDTEPKSKSWGVKDREISIAEDGKFIRFGNMRL